MSLSQCIMVDFFRFEEAHSSDESTLLGDGSHSSCGGSQIGGAGSQIQLGPTE